jgi:hypothetical protein
MDTMLFANGYETRRLYYRGVRDDELEDAVAESSAAWSAYMAAERRVEEIVSRRAALAQE